VTGNRGQVERSRALPGQAAPGPQSVRRRSAGFTLVEALVATTITTLAGASIVLSLSSSVTTTDVVLEQTIAQGIAASLLDEAAGLRYSSTTLDPWAGSSGGSSPAIPVTGSIGSTLTSTGARIGCSAVDDLHGYQFLPADRWGIVLGQGDGHGGLRHPHLQLRSSYFSGWLTTVEVYYVSDSDLSVRLPAGQTSGHKTVRVRVSRTYPNGSTRPLADMRRVFADVPSS